MLEDRLSGTWGPRAYWLLSRHGRSHEIFLTLQAVIGVEPGNSQALPVFSEERYAASFMDSSALDAGAWRVRSVDGGELISVLYGPCGRVAGVALDPTDSTVVAGSGLRVDMDRGEFLDVISQRRHAPEERGRSHTAVLWS